MSGGVGFLSGQTLSAAVLVAAAAVAGGLNSGAGVAFLGSKPAHTKPFASFSEFYPHYLSEHSAIMTKRMHYIGTSLFLLMLVLSKGRLAGPIAAGAAAGYAVFPLLRHLSSGLPEMAIMVGTYLGCAYAATRSWGTVFAPMVLAYGFAWFGHFRFEGNKPATFIYPTFSLIGDFRMFADMLMGRQPL